MASSVALNLSSQSLLRASSSPSLHPRQAQLPFSDVRCSRSRKGLLRGCPKPDKARCSTTKCKAASETNFTPFEERAQIKRSEQAPSVEDLLSGDWLEATEQQALLVSERLALGAQDVEEEIARPEKLSEDEIVEYQEDPNVALIVNPEGDLVGTYVGPEAAVSWVESLDKEQAVTWFWNRLEETHYQRFLSKGGEWWRGDEWEKRPPHWYEYTCRDGKRVVWGQRTRILSDSVEDLTADTLERVARFLAFHEEGSGSLASQPEGSLGRYLMDRILESRTSWVAEGTISPLVSDLEAGDEKWSEYLTRKWKDLKNGFMENTYGAWREGVAIDNRVGQQYYVPKKFGWKGPAHRTM